MPQTLPKSAYPFSKHWGLREPCLLFWRKSWTTAIAQVIGPAESPATGRNVSPTIGLTGVADDVGARAML